MKLKIYFLAAIALGFLSGHAFAFQSKYTAGLEEFTISDAQRAQLIQGALDGSGDSAFRLFQFYGYVLNDTKEALRWAIIGAENGDARCQYSAAVTLIALNSEDDKTRALFWLKKAADQGLKQAQQELDLYAKTGKL